MELVVAVVQRVHPWRHHPPSPRRLPLTLRIAGLAVSVRHAQVGSAAPSGVGVEQAVRTVVVDVKACMDRAVAV